MKPIGYLFLLLATSARADPASDKLLADARAAVARNPEDQRAWRSVGAASCMRKDRVAAAEAVRHLKSDADVKLVQRVCETNGLRVDRSPEVTWVDPNWSERAVGGPDVERDLNRAMDAYVNGRYYEAIAVGAQVLLRAERNPKAWRIVGAAACYCKDGETARLALNNLGNMDRQFVKYICYRNEIPTEPIDLTPATAKQISALARSYSPLHAVEPLVP